MTQPVPTYRPPSATQRTFRSTVPVPVIVNVAFWMIIGESVLALIVLILGAIALAGARSEVGPSFITGTLLGGAIGLLLRVGIAVILRRGYGPARVFLTIVTAFSIVITTVHGFDPISLLQLPIVVIPVILVWLPQANRYFRTVGAARRQAKAAGMTVGFLG